MTQANVEMAQFTRASLHNVIAKDMYGRLLAKRDPPRIGAYILQRDTFLSFFFYYVPPIHKQTVSGSTIFNGIKDLENSDWTDTYLRGDQRKYLCSHPTAKGTNPQTGADTRESLLCVD
jgi:hypothetical protein